MYVGKSLTSLDSLAPPPMPPTTMATTAPVSPSHWRCLCPLSECRHLGRGSGLRRSASSIWHLPHHYLLDAGGSNTLSPSPMHNKQLLLCCKHLGNGYQGNALEFIPVHLGQLGELVNCILGGGRGGVGWAGGRSLRCGSSKGHF